MTMMTNLKQNSGQLSASFRDPSGFLFSRDGMLYRQVNRKYEQEYARLKESGLYDKLIKAGLLIPHVEVEQAPEQVDLAYIIIQPERVPFISYPYEWSFSQLKDAALATLSIQRRALKVGMSLKDASAYNLQFVRGKATLIDTLSFELYKEGQPWVAYRQFCQHFLAPLALMALRDVRLNQRIAPLQNTPQFRLADSYPPACRCPKAILGRRSEIACREHEQASHDRVDRQPRFYDTKIRLESRRHRMGKLL
jgi:hypothetical protein